MCSQTCRTLIDGDKGRFRRRGIVTGEGNNNYTHTELKGEESD